MGNGTGDFTSTDAPTRDLTTPTRKCQNPRAWAAFSFLVVLRPSQFTWKKGAGGHRGGVVCSVPHHNGHLPPASADNKPESKPLNESNAHDSQR